MMTRTFAYCLWRDLTDWLDCGWMVSKPNAASHHNHYGCVVEWRCGCKLARPK